jgi:hypothetical protein
MTAVQQKFPRRARWKSATPRRVAAVCGAVVTAGVFEAARIEVAEAAEPIETVGATSTSHRRHAVTAAWADPAPSFQGGARRDLPLGRRLSSP